MRPSTRRRRIGAPSDPQPRHLAFPPPERNSIYGVPNQNLNSDQDQTDLISRLPDCMLSSILLLVPLKDSVRTSILSSRWRDLWKLNPLYLDDSIIKSDQQNGYETRQAITQIASAHPGPIHSFRISQFDDVVFHPEVDDLVETLTRKGIRELALSFRYRGRFRYRLPFSLLQCKTLCKVSLSDCFFPPSPVVSSSFPNLRELSLEFVFLFDDLLHCLLKSCAKLEELQLINCSGLQYVRLCCAKLQKLTIHEQEVGGGRIKEVVIDAPDLRSLRLGETTVDCTRFSVQHVQKLEVLGFFSLDGTMRIGNIFSKPYIQYETTVNGRMMLPTVKKLAILIGFANGLKLSVLSAVLRCFPCLETLDIKCVKSIKPAAQVGFWKQQAPFSFLNCHLKSVTMVNFFGLKVEVEFVKFLVQHGRVLERITIFCEHKLTSTWVDAKRGKLRGKLCLKNRASKDLEVVFLCNSNCDSDSCEWVSLFSLPVA